MILDELRQQLKPPCPVLDIHAHPCHAPTVEEDAQALITAAKRSGVEKICLSTLLGGYEPSMDECRKSNNYTFAMKEVAHSVFVPFCYVNPAFPGESVNEIERCMKKTGLGGIKLWVARRAKDRGLDPILEIAAELRLPILQHAWDKTTGNLPQESFPWDVADLAKRHPKAKIIMAHLNGAGLRGLEAMAEYTNIYVDTSGGDPESGMVEIALEKLGPKRILYGSDVPGRHFGVQMGKVLGANIPEDIKRNILWDNGAQILPDWVMP